MPANGVKVDMVTDLKLYRTEAALPLSFCLRQCKSVGMVTIAITW